jgi:hypothetical protein
LRHDLFVLAGGNVQDRACFIYQRSSDAAGANVDGECEIAAQGKPPGGKRQRLSDPALKWHSAGEMAASARRLRAKPNLAVTSRLRTTDLE